mgnify:CR=1 FL=1
MAGLHIYTAGHQPATRFVDDHSGRRIWFRHPKQALAYCWKCRKRRWVSHLTVQVFFDSLRFWCAPSHGCAKERA